MKLLRLKLENFRQHRETDIRFSQGMTAIVGANGTGKTTILEAITFALYGVQRKTKESVKFYWAEPRSRMRVTLEFEFEDRRYVLERSPTDASLLDVTADPQVTKATGLREAKAACERLLRLSYDQFKNSFCAEQKSLAFLQFNTDTRRQEQVAKMLGFDRLKSAAELAYKRGKHFRWQADEIARTIGDPFKLRADALAARDELNTAYEARKLVIELRGVLAAQLPTSEQAKLLADEFFRLTQEARVFKSNADALENARKRAEEACLRADADVRKQAELRPQHEEFVKLEKTVREMQALREKELDREKAAAELTRLEAELLDTEARIASLHLTNVKVLQQGVQSCGEIYTKASITLREADAAWSRLKQGLQARLSTAQAEVKQAQNALAKAQALVEQGICPECGQVTTASFADKLKCLQLELKDAQGQEVEASQAFTQAEARPKTVFEAEDALEVARLAHSKAQEVLTAAEKSHAEAKGLQEERASKQKKVAALKADLAKRESKYDRELHLASETVLRELRPQHEAYLRLGGAEEACKAAQGALEAAKREIDEANKHFEALRAERSKLPFKTSEEAKEAITEFDALRRKAADAEAQEKHADALVKLGEGRLQQAEEKLRGYEQAEASLKESRAQALLHETADKELKLLREELNSVIRPELEARASENLSLLTNGRYPLLELDDEFNATVVEDGIQKQVISGGEEDVVALALRMALSELIQERQGRPMSLMILDEVFGSLDADRRQAVLERLQAVKGRFAQILVISHIEEINQVADQCIFLTRDERTRSTVIGDLPVDTGELVLT